MDPDGVDMSVLVLQEVFYKNAIHDRGFLYPLF